MARVNTMVSRPSRPTAWNASTPSPSRALPLSASSDRRRRSADNVRLCDCIQNVMYVKTAAATRNVNVSKMVWTVDPSYCLMTRYAATPPPITRTTAAATPSNTSRKWRRCPIWSR